MNKKEALKIYKSQLEKINAYQLILNTAHYDKETIAPKKGNKERNKALAYMGGEAFGLTHHLDISRPMHWEVL